MNRHPPVIVSFEPGQDPADLLRAGDKPGTFQILLGFRINTKKSSVKRFAVIIDHNCKIRRRVAHAGAAKVDNSANTFRRAIKHYVIRRNIRIDQFRLKSKIIFIGEKVFKMFPDETRT